MYSLKLFRAQIGEEVASSEKRVLHETAVGDFWEPHCGRVSHAVGFTSKSLDGHVLSVGTAHIYQRGTKSICILSSRGFPHVMDNRACWVSVKNEHSHVSVLYHVPCSTCRVNPEPYMCDIYSHHGPVRCRTNKTWPITGLKSTVLML